MSSEEPKSGKDEKKRAVSASEECPYTLPGPTPAVEDITIPAECVAWLARGYGTDQHFVRTEAPTDGSIPFQDYGLMLHVKKDKKDNKPKGMLFFVPITYGAFKGLDRDEEVDYPRHWNEGHLDQFGVPFEVFVEAAQPAGGSHTRLHSRMAEVIRKKFGIKMNDKLTRAESVEIGEYIYAGAVYKSDKEYLFAEIHNRSQRNDCVEWHEDYLDFTQRLPGDRPRLNVAIPKEVMEVILKAMERLPGMIDEYLKNFLATKEGEKWAEEKIIWPKKLASPQAYHFGNYEVEEEWWRIFHNSKEKDGSGENGLMRAIRKYKNIPNKWIEKFMGFGVNLNDANNKGDTALHIAVQEGAEETTEALILAGCKADKTNEAGETPFSIALKKESFTIANLLFEAGAAVPEDAYKNKGFVKEILSSVMKADDVDKFARIVEGCPKIYQVIFSSDDDSPLHLLRKSKKILNFMAQSDVAETYSSQIKEQVKNFLKSVGPFDPSGGLANAVNMVNAFAKFLDDFNPGIFIDYYLVNLDANEMPNDLLACLGASGKPEAKGSQPVISDVIFKGKLVNALLDYYQTGDGSFAPVKSEMLKILAAMKPAALMSSAGQFPRSKASGKKAGSGGVGGGPSHAFRSPSR